MSAGDWLVAKMKNWYLIQFKPNSHRLAERNLRRQGFETFLPMQKITRRKTSRFVNELKPLFPGYMFVSFNLEPAPWRTLNSTIGVSSLVSFGANQHHSPLQLISGLMRRCDASGVLLPPNRLSEGDRVKMLSGTFANFIATVDTIDPEQRIWVLIDFMGQKRACRLLQTDCITRSKILVYFLYFSEYSEPFGCSD